MDALERRLMPAPRAQARAYWWFKAVVFALLAWNTAVFVYSGTVSEGLDSIAWLVLLALFELETGAAAAPSRWAAVIQGARLVAAMAIPVAAIGYFLDREWFDTINSALWIAVVVVLELQVRFPAAAAGYRAWSGVVLAALYASLAAIAVVWLWRAEWFSAYDAILWLLAFVTIEINVLQALRRRPANAPVRHQSSRMAG
jgi:hypothetical protein